MFIFYIIISFIILIYYILVKYLQFKEYRILNFQHLDTRFPSQFKFGISTSAYQYEGGVPNTDFKNWELKNNWINKYNNDVEKTDIYNNEHWSTPDGWDMFDEDLENLKELGVKSFRFTLEWARIQPERPLDTANFESYYDMDAMNRYIDRCKKLKEAGIDIVLSLVHYTLPRMVI